MQSNDNIINILYLNIRGQTKFYLDKQLQLQETVKRLKCDIVQLQETHIEEDTFQNCDFIKNNFTVISNNSTTGYGTSSLIRNELKAENIIFDTEGRVIVFDINNITYCNVYMNAGTDNTSRASRENYFSAIIPNLLVNRCRNGYAGGDWNCIIDKKDATNHENVKMSPSLSRMCKLFSWHDSHRSVHPSAEDFSHYYNVGGAVNATRIDRQYYWGNMEVIKSEYIPSAFSDHFGLLTQVKVPYLILYKNIPCHPSSFKISNEISRDPLFIEQVSKSMPEWKKVLSNGLDILIWWDLVVKPGLKSIALERQRQLRKDQRGELNLLLINQSYLVKKLRTSSFNNPSFFNELKCTQSRIQNWYMEQSKKIQDQCRRNEFLPSEDTRIYHHDLHRQSIKRSSILELNTEEGLLQGHDKCSSYLEATVRALVGSEAELDCDAQNFLLGLMSNVFTSEDNVMLEAEPTKSELYETLRLSNLNASAGSDGITGLVYKECWSTLGDSILEVCKAIFSGSTLPSSMRTVRMNFCPKPKKPNSTKPGDKRRISVLNCDFKIYEGFIARRFRKLGGRTLSPSQYVAGKNRLIHHGIARARDAIFTANRLNLRCGIGDQDYIAAFDYLVLSWVWRVLEKKGVCSPTLNRLTALYSNGIIIPVVNSIPGRPIYDIRGSLRQGGVGSMEWFSFGIDPLLVFLDLNLSGILISSLPVLGPVKESEEFPLPFLEERFKVMAYCDDVKPAICSIEEFEVADKGASLFEKAAGTRLHRDPITQKCKFLALGRWKRELKQEDIPTPYMQLTDCLDMVGVQLCATWAATRRENGNNLRGKVANLIGCWRTGKFLPLCLRPHSVNTYALSKVWFRSSTVNLREGDYNAINSSIKKWLYSDLLFKPEQLLLYRTVSRGGLGLISVKLKCQAHLLKTFVDLAVNPLYIHSQYLSTLFRVKVLGEKIDNIPPPPPYYDETFFDHIRLAAEAGKEISKMKIKQWYQFLYFRENYIANNHDVPLNAMLPCKVELLKPEIDWGQIYSKLKISSLPSDVRSFGWKLIHQLLPCESLLNQRLLTNSDKCRFSCDLVANLDHCLFECTLVEEVGLWVMGIVKKSDPAANRCDVVCLKLPESESLVWIVLQSLKFAWCKRLDGKIALVMELVAMMRSTLQILLNSDHQKIAEEVLQLIDGM